MVEKEHTIRRLEKAGLVVVGKLKPEERQRLEELEPDEVESLVRILEKVSTPGHGAVMSYGNKRQTGLSE